MNDYHCPTCKPRWPVYCAPQRCYCGHADCPAHASYVHLTAPATPTHIPAPRNTTWDTREEDTWIDRL